MKHNKKLPKSYIAIYGNVKIPKAYCEDCDGYYFVINGRFACCDKQAQIDPQKYIRESEADQTRKRPPLKERKEILDLQNHCCIYCESPFGFIRYKKTRPFKLRLEWDHQVPFAFSQDNSTSNYVAACHVCNSLKSNKCFQTVNEAAAYLSAARHAKGYNF